MFSTVDVRSLAIVAAGQEEKETVGRQSTLRFLAIVSPKGGCTDNGFVVKGRNPLVADQKEKIR